MNAQLVRGMIHLHLQQQVRRWVVLHELTLGPTWSTCGGGRGRVYRADLWCLSVGWKPPRSRIYEIKTSRADLVHELRSRKYERALPQCSEFVFAVPEGLKVEPREVPEPCGLVRVLHDAQQNRIRVQVLKAPAHRPWVPHWPQLLAALMCVETRLELPKSSRCKGGRFSGLEHVQRQRRCASVRALQALEQRARPHTHQRGQATGFHIAVLRREIAELKQENTRLRAQAREGAQDGTRG